MWKATQAEKKVAKFLWVSYYVEHWRGLGICCYVRPADEHIKETKFPRNDKTSQQTKSVAESAGGLENVRPKTELQ